LQDDQQIKEQLVNYRDSHLGSQAIHLAAATGNHNVIDCLILSFQADVRQTTNSN
jgi:hypothetical protein